MKTKERGSHDLYDEPGVVGSLGGVAPYAKAQKISIAQVKKEFEKSFVYRLHKQGRWWTMGDGSYQSTDFSQAEQRVSLHLSGHWCLFQICVGSIH